MQKAALFLFAGSVFFLFSPGAEAGELTDDPAIRVAEADYPRPRLLIVSRNLPPLTGGMERLNARLLRALATRFRCTVIGPPGAAAAPPQIENLRTDGSLREKTSRNPSSDRAGSISFADVFTPRPRFCGGPSRAPSSRARYKSKFRGSPLRAARSEAK